MSDPFAERPVPTAAVVAGGAIMAFALVAASLGALTREDRAVDVLAPTAERLASRAFLFEDRADTAVVVRDHETGAVVHVFEVHEEGFARSVLRVLASARAEKGLGPEGAAMTLTGWSDGRLTLADPSTGEIIQLGAFGRTNAGVFARLLETASDAGRADATISGVTGRVDG